MRSPAAFTLSEERNVTSSLSCRLFHVTLRQINRPASNAKNSGKQNNMWTTGYIYRTVIYLFMLQNVVSRY